MATWKRPELPSGALRDLNDALHELRDRTGLSSRQIARAVQLKYGTDAPSHTTVHQMFTQARLQPAELVLRVAEVLLDAQLSRSPGTYDAELDRIDGLWRLAAEQRRPDWPEPATAWQYRAATPAWRPVAAPVPGLDSELRDIVAVDAIHAWAVGRESRPTGAFSVICRWDGEQWSRVPLPERRWPGGLHRVAAGSCRDVWAVGSGYADATEHQTVTHVLRYDGGDWREVPFPAGNTPGFLRITGLTAVDGHAWLVGSDGLRVAIHEFDGRSWQEHQPPAQCQPGGFHSGIPANSYIGGMTAFAPDDIWACGHGTWPGFTGPLLLHWDGNFWRTVPVGVDESAVAFNAIAGRSSDDMWMVGNTPIPGSADITPESMVVHGDGESWERVDGLPPVKLTDVTLDAAGFPWLIHGDPEPTSTLASYDTGTGSWIHMFAPGPPGTVGMDLDGIAAVPGSSTVFAVGAARCAVPPARQAVILESCVSECSRL